MPEKTVIDVLEDLESVNARTYKETVLRRRASDDLLRRIFVAASDPYRNYFVSQFRLPSVSDGVPSHEVDDDDYIAAFLDILENDIMTRKVVGKAARQHLEAFFSGLPTRRIQEWCRRILLKNLRVGVSETTIDKVWPGSIRKFSVQLAESLDVRNIKGEWILKDDVAFPLWVEPKLDGLRCVAIKAGGEVTLYTRSGSVIDTLPTIAKTVAEFPVDDVVFDGECMGKDWNESSSVVMSKKTRKDDSCMTYHVFDMIPLATWRDQSRSFDLYARRRVMHAVVPTIGPVRIVEGVQVGSVKELFEVYSRFLEQRYEGAMVKSPDAAYDFKRSRAVLKMKPVASRELVIVGYHEGNAGSKREGQFGGFDAVADNGVVTSVGGGFDDKLRAAIQLDRPESYVGKVIECEYQPDPTTQDGLTRDGRLRFPVFIRFRDSRDCDQRLLQVADKYVSGGMHSA